MQHFPNDWSMQIFLTSGIGPDILMKVFEGPLYSLFWQADFCLIFILSKNKRFLSVALLILHPSSPFMNEFRQQQKSTKKM